MKPKMATLVPRLTLCLWLLVPLASAASALPNGAMPAETGAKAAHPATPGDAGKSGSAAGMTNGTGSRQGGTAGLGTHGRSGAAGEPPPH